MSGENWQDGTLYDDKGEFALARIRYALGSTVELDGFQRVTGDFRLQKELCPLHTGMARLMAAAGDTWLVRILLVSRPAGSGEFEMVEKL